MRPHRPFLAKAVLFDFDGTLTRPGSHDWAGLKERLGCPPTDPVLEFVEALPEGFRKTEAMAALDRFEAEGAAVSRPSHAAEETIAALRRRGLPVGILTRNSREAIDRSLDNFAQLSAADFDLVITRETPVPVKPAPDGVRYFADAVGVPVESVLMVGDFRLDVEAGAAAGAVTVLLDHGRTEDPTRVTPDYRIDRLDQLVDLIRLGTPISGGKLPNDLLEVFLGDCTIGDPELVIHPGIGEDIAAVEMPAPRVVVLKSDPITFVTDAIGRYAVLVNANDIATSGAIPRWFLTTLLFPPGTTPSQIRAVMQELHVVCEQWGITLCGGHTEVTDAVTRPVVTGMLAGTVTRDRLIDKRNMGAGDVVLLTKGVAVEGTAIIAREFSDRLGSLGMRASEIRRAAEYLDRIGVLEEARIAADSPGTSAMHDVTEGGLATALEELSAAGGHCLRIEKDRIPIYAETARACDLLGIDPLGLIGSGSLLITCRADAADNLVQRLDRAGIPVTRIGSVTHAGRGIEAIRGGRPADWPRFEADELTRLF